eukprot:gene27148-biopygen17695
MLETQHERQEEQPFAEVFLVALLNALP